MNMDTPQTILCLHASASTSRQWRPLQTMLASNYRVVTPDLYGYGHAPLPKPGYSVADEIALSMSQLAVDERFHLVGHSFGGAVALHIAHRFPERVRSLTLYEPAMFAYLAAIDLEAYIEIRRVRDEAMWFVDTGRLPEAAACFVSYWAGEQAWQQMSMRAKQAVIDGMCKVKLEWATVFHRGLDSAEISTINVPTLLLSGTNSTKAGRASSNYIHHHMPNSRLLELPMLDHVAPLTQPELVNSHIASFLLSCDENHTVRPESAL